ncbi:MAG: AAA family ATPase [Bacteroidota bacterium]
MEAIIFIGIQATGKSSFYQVHFFNSHVRISLDLLNTRNKESRFLETCFQTHSAFVVDNTNPEKEQRQRYIQQARAQHYRVIGYYFQSQLEEALRRNEKRTGKAKIPEPGIRACYHRLEIPSYQEGFDRLYYVKMQDSGFTILDWQDEI